MKRILLLLLVAACGRDPVGPSLSQRAGEGTAATLPAMVPCWPGDTATARIAGFVPCSQVPR